MAASGNERSMASIPRVLLEPIKTSKEPLVPLFMEEKNIEELAHSGNLNDLLALREMDALFLTYGMKASLTFVSPVLCDRFQKLHQQSKKGLSEFKLDIPQNDPKVLRDMYSKLYDILEMENKRHVVVKSEEFIQKLIGYAHAISEISARYWENKRQDKKSPEKPSVPERKPAISEATVISRLGINPVRRKFLPPEDVVSVTILQTIYHNSGLRRR